jgi:hypothetical protein
MIIKNNLLKINQIVDDYEIEMKQFNIDPFESYKHHSICARATLYPNKTIDEVEEIVEDMREFFNLKY